MNRPGTALLATACLLASACCSVRPPAAPPSPARDAYLAAVEKRLQGDARGYFDGLVAVAHLYPETRAGRRARATLQGSDLYAVYAAGVAAAVAIPAFRKYLARSRQTEPAERLLAIHMAEQVHRVQDGTLCPDPASCRFTLEGTHYVYFLGPDRVLGGDLAEDRDALIARARPLLDTIGLVPRLDPEGYFVVAIGDPDGDEDLDVWTIDETGEPYHLHDDLDSDDEAFGL